MTPLPQRVWSNRWFTGFPVSRRPEWHGTTVTFPDWRGDVFVGALVDKEVRRIELDQGRVIQRRTATSNTAVAKLQAALTR